MYQLYTFGYSGRRPDQLRTLAERLRSVVVDIRFSPRSRIPPWTDGRLRKVLGKRYRHLPALGNRNYKGGPIEFVDLQTGHNRNFDPANIPLDDPQTGELLARGDTVGVFQCESEGACKTLRQLQAKYHNRGEIWLTNRKILATQFTKSKSRETSMSSGLIGSRT
jgi:uncharacterized protein (DUF488 family)